MTKFSKEFIDNVALAFKMANELTEENASLKARVELLEGQLAALVEAAVEWKATEASVHKTCGTKWGFCTICRSEIAPTDASETNRKIYVHSPKCPIKPRVASSEDTVERE